MNTRRVMTWAIFWCSVVLALGALAWVSVEVVALEQREAESRVQASRQESIRRALWRLDSTMAPVLAIEAARPSSAYQSIEPVPMSFIGESVDVGMGQGVPDSYANRYFNALPSEDAYGSIQPQPEMQESASAEELAMDLNEQAEPLSRKMQTDSDFDARNRIAQIATQNSASPQRAEQPPSNERQPSGAAGDAESDTLLETRPQTKMGQSAYTMPADTAFQGSIMPSTPAVGSLTPRWIDSDAGPRLVLVRDALLNGQPVIQGVELDWDQLRTDLLESITDVLPGATLVPSGTGQAAGLYRMATIPVALIPPRAPALPGWSWSPARVGLVVTWIAILATIIAVGVVLRAAIVLSQRRGRFVSAVTHELRTPLTTFRLYSQMLADGMVSDEQVRRDYLSTLKRESERLTGIVENVLEYARLSRVRPGRGKAAGVQTLSPGALVARFRPALARRLGQSNLDLVVSLDLDEHQERTVTVDPHAVERVMMNLIENACKYASPSAEDEPDASEEFDTRVHLDVRVHDEMLELLIADHGPGIAPGERARIFGEFQRGSRGLGNARSGLGLGLALSRGLAREMGGDLQLVSRRGHGAEFLLSIPLDPEP